MTKTNETETATTRNVAHYNGKIELSCSTSRLETHIRTHAYIEQEGKRQKEPH